MITGVPRASWHTYKRPAYLPASYSVDDRNTDLPVGKSLEARRALLHLISALL